jgi:hypothetical protein
MTLRLECFLKIRSEDHLPLRIGVSECFLNSGDLSSDVPMQKHNPRLSPPKELPREVRLCWQRRRGVLAGAATAEEP